MTKTFNVSEVREWVNQLYNEEITFSRFVEILNKRCVENKHITKQALEEIINTYTEGNYLLGSSDKVQMISEIMDLVGANGSLTHSEQLDELREWLCLEITERRDYTASRAYEEVLKMMDILSKADKCICNSVEESENCDRNCGTMGQ